MYNATSWRGMDERHYRDRTWIENIHVQYQEEKTTKTLYADATGILCLTTVNDSVSLQQAQRAEPSVGFAIRCS